MRQNHYLINIIVYTGLTLLSYGLYAFHFPYPYSNLLFSFSFLAFFFLSSEIFYRKAGIYFAFLTAFMQLLIFNYINVVIVVVATLFYLIVKQLKKSKQKSTAQRERHFKALVNLGSHPLILTNNDGQISFVSNTIKDIFGWKKYLSPQRSLKELIHPQDQTFFEKILTELLKKPGKKVTTELRMKKDEDSWIWARIDSVNLLNHKDVNAIVSAIQDITLQKHHDQQKTEALKLESLARSVAENAVQQRDEFLSIASHELKTPLTTILLHLQSTLRRVLTQSLADFSGADLLKSIQIAEKQSQRLSSLIKDLLNVSIASTGRITLNKENLNLVDLVASLVERFDEEIKLTGSKINLNLEQESILGDWDPIRIEQLISNLITNAMKYGEGKPITITVKRSDDHAQVLVSDQGVGIPADHIDKIFEPFKRISNGKTTDGLGVGLFIARQIAIAHDGDITVDSSPDQGSTFCLTLPALPKTQ